jgi:putative FmdB family regulatory protein
MPIYDYKCQGCGNEFEAFVLPQSKGKPECPSCHSQRLEQLLSAFAVNSEERSQTVLKAARKKYLKGEFRDKKIAEREDMERHHH